jgi:PilZ domain
MPFWRAAILWEDIVESQDNFVLDRVDACGSDTAYCQSLAMQSLATWGASEMGVVRNLKPQLSLEPAAYRKPVPIEPKEVTQEGLHPRRIIRVPTHAINVAEDRRRSPRASLSLPLRLTNVGGTAEPTPITLVTKNISSTGVYFLAPRCIDPGTAIELEVDLVERPLGRGSVRLRTAAHVVRTDACDVPGWIGYAATFDDYDFEHDDVLPRRFGSF